jgi:hypothetical protein
LGRRLGGWFFLLTCYLLLVTRYPIESDQLMLDFIYFVSDLHVSIDHVTCSARLLYLPMRDGSLGTMVRGFCARQPIHDWIRR